MGPVEGVAGKGQNQLPDLVGHILADALLTAALLEDRPVLGHQLLVLLADRLDHDIGLAQGVIGHRLEQLHDLLLVDDHAVGIFQDGPEDGVQIMNAGRVILALNVVRDLLQRAGPVERYHRVDILDAGGPQLHKVAGHPRRLHLEDVLGLATPQ